ncbi:Flagella associated protein, partial [Aduncisulcus paluster]
MENFATKRQFVDPYKTDFRKSHAFDKTAGQVMFNPDKKGIGSEELASTKILDKTATKRAQTKFDPVLTYTLTKESAQYSGEYVPSYVALDRMVLEFYGSFQEAVHESRDEIIRRRHAKIRYYLEDGSIDISEPVMNNSGIPQGMFLRRHRVPTHDDPTTFVGLEDLVVGGDVVLYKRKFHIHGINASTRDYLKTMGFEPGPNESCPTDPYTMKRIDDEQRLMVHERVTPKVEEDMLARFLTKDRQVLRFFGIWDDRKSMFGDVRVMRIYFYLVDDTVEVLESIPTNSGRDKFPVFLRRSKLPHLRKTLEDVTNPKDCYKEDEFYVGAVISVLGRPIRIVECDDYTQAHLRSKGFPEDKIQAIGKAEPIKHRVTAPAPTVPEYTLKIGTAEDTKGSCLAVRNKPPKRDFQREMALGESVIRYAAKLVGSLDGTVPCRATDEPREFVVGFYPANCTVAVFEKRIEASVPGGKFLERTRLINPLTGSYFDYDDFEVDGVVEINKHFFKLTAIDEHSLKTKESTLKTLREMGR